MAAGWGIFTNNNRGCFMKASCPGLRYLLLGLLFLFAVGPIALYAQPKAGQQSVETLLPSDGITVDVMQLVHPPRMEELTKKLAAAIAKNPEWWASHVKKAKPGEPVEYDVRLGVTQAEFTEYLALTKKGVYKKVAAAKVEVKRDGDRVVLSFGDQLPNLKTLELDLKADVVTTPFGVASNKTQIVASDGQTATGPWDGVQWKVAKVEEKPARSTSMQIALGKLKESGRGILYYNLSQVSDQSRVNARYVLQYDLKGHR